MPDGPRGPFSRTFLVPHWPDFSDRLRSDNGKVLLRFTGWTTDGKLFRSTILDGRDAEWDVNRITAEGLREGIQLMVKGEKRRLWIPPELAYKNQPNGPQGMVVMDVELVRILR